MKCFKCSGNGQASTKYSNRVLFKSSSTFQNCKNRVPSEYRVNLNFSKSSTSTSTEYCQNRKIEYESEYFNSSTPVKISIWVWRWPILELFSSFLYSKHIILAHKLLKRRFVWWFCYSCAFCSVFRAKLLTRVPIEYSIEYSERVPSEPKISKSSTSTSTE